MDKQLRPMKTSNRLLLGIGSIFVIAGIIIVALVNNQARKQALVEAEAKAQIILNRNHATHTYFTHQLKPKLFRLTDPIGSDAYFEPTWMSSTYAIREIDKYFESLESSEYYYKESAINARSPENEADEYEKSFIEELKANSELMTRSVKRVLNDKLYFVVLHRGEVMEESCLRCHSTPEKAPGDLVRYYGPERSFNRKIGEVVSINSIRVPLSAAYAMANRFSLRLSIILITVLAALFFLQYWFNKLLVFKPLSTIHQKALLISNSDEHLGEEIPLPPSRELNEVTAAFNKMSIRLRHQMDQLEERVQERTVELRELNKQLKKEIEERKQVEEALQESEELHRITLSNISDAVFITDNTGDFTYICLNADIIFGYSFEEVSAFGNIDKLLGINFFDCNEFESSKEIKNRECEIQDKSGVAHVLLVNIKSVSIKGGTVLYTCRDITERKQVVEALQKSHDELEWRVKERTAELTKVNEKLKKEIDERKWAEEFLIEEKDKAQNYLNIAGTMILALDANGNVSLVNRKGCQILEYNQNEIIGKNWFDNFLPKRMRKDVKEIFSRLMNGEIELFTHVDGYSILSSSNKEKHMSWYNSLVIDSEGKAIGTLSSGEDITARRQDKEALQKTNQQLLREIEEHEKTDEKLMQSERKYKTVADFTYDWEYWANLDDTLEYVSPSCERISGYSVQDFMENPSLFREIVVSEDREIWDQHVCDAKKDLSLREVQFRIKRKDGKIRWIEHACQPVFDHQGGCESIRASNRDITVRKQIENTLQESREKAEELAKKLISTQEAVSARLARELHDDIIQRLAFLKIEVDKLEMRNESLPEPLRDNLRQIGRDIGELSSDIQLISYRLHPITLDVLGLVRSIETECNNFTRLREIPVTLDLDGTLQNLSREVSLCAYRILQEGFRNIVRHAKATDVHVTLSKKNDILYLLIKDNGIGFDPASNTKKTGLGIASMTERTNLIQGDLSVESQPGKGTAIKLAVPLKTRNEL